MPPGRLKTAQVKHDDCLNSYESKPQQILHPEFYFSLLPADALGKWSLPEIRIFQLVYRKAIRHCRNNYAAFTDRIYFPRVKQHSVWISALLFIFWKSPFSQPLIDVYNEYSFIQTSRIVDLTDLFVLLLLPIPFFLIKRIDRLLFLQLNKPTPVLILLPTVLALVATSPPPSYYYTRTNGNLACYRCNITVRYNQDEIVEKLRQADIVFDSIAPIDSFAMDRLPGLKNEHIYTYRLNRLVIDNDTLRNLDFTMRTIKNKKTKIYFNGMQVSDDISTMQLEKKLRNYYKKILFKELKGKLHE